ncbi:glycosyltransferase family 2 protein [Hymenobacter baengnokdamensis]|uniref:glycosyltransferase family 2 protein n=1 Tax=Hymenobacter baengnokdamensis TaxID=2615203 RepID=UPI00124538D6|nr:glycosyltransferase [Hymenobacter baengnokdamensis]
MPKQPDATIPLVSVMMVTYNQEAYIEAALDSVLVQQVDFNYEIVVGEDYSTDQTRAILRRYEQSHADRIRVLWREKNLGVSRNWDATMHQCRGTYVALLEGDDYWTNPHKLQKQVDFLEANPDFSFCFHNARVLYEGGGAPPASHQMTQEQKPEFTLFDVTGEWHIATGSVVYRRALMLELPEWIHQSVVVDLPLFAILGNKGRIGFLNEEMSIYRVNSGGVTQTAKKEAFLLGLIRMYKNLDQHLAFIQHRNFMIKIADAYQALASSLNTQERYSEARPYLLQALRSRLAARAMPRKDMFKVLAISLMPGLYRRLYKEQ